jgi:protein ImuB
VSASPLAFRRLRPPREVVVEADAGEPVRITLSTRPERILARVGPWRSSGEWWDTRGFARDEWDVALPDGMVCRLAHDRRRGRWYLEGAYD